MATWQGTITTTGSAGSATGLLRTPRIRGHIEAITIDYHASAPATTNIYIDEIGGLGQEVVARTDSTTDVSGSLRVGAIDKAGSAISGSAVRYFIDDHVLEITVNDSNALAAAVVVSIVVDGYIAPE